MMYFEHPRMAEIVLINVGANGSPNGNSNVQLPIVDTNGVALTSEVVKSKASHYQSASRNGNNDRTPDYEEPRKLMVQKSPLSRFTGGYEKPYAHPLRSGPTVGFNQVPISNSSSRPHYQSSSVCSSNDSSSSVGDSHSTCSSSLSHGSPTNVNSTLAVAASIEILPECIQRLALRRAPVPPSEHSSRACPVIEAPLNRVNSRFASRQRIPDSEDSKLLHPLPSDEVETTSNQTVHPHCYIPRVASAEALNEKTVHQASNKSRTISYLVQSNASQSLETNCETLPVVGQDTTAHTVPVTCPAYAPASTNSMSTMNQSSPSNLSTTNHDFSQNPILSELEMNRIELFYRSQRTQVFVAGALARLLFTRAALSANRRQSAPLASLWTEAASGVPVLLLDRGGLKTRARRQLRLCLADRRSGFPLFSDLIDHLSDYKSLSDSDLTTQPQETLPPSSECLHAFYLSTDHRKMAGLRFLSLQSGIAFLNRMQIMTSVPANIALTGPKQTGPKSASTNLTASSQLRLDEASSKSLKGSKRKNRKNEISLPCLFQHVTSLNLSDVPRLHQLISVTNAAISHVDAMQRTPD